MWPEGMTWVKTGECQCHILYVSFNSLEVACLWMQGRRTVDTHQFSTLLPPDRPTPRAVKTSKVSPLHKLTETLKVVMRLARNTAVLFLGYSDRKGGGCIRQKVKYTLVVINGIFWRFQSPYWTSSDESLQNTKSFPIGLSSAQEICE